MTVYDITMPLNTDLAVWPGDTPVSVTSTMAIHNGESVNLSTIQMSLHAGTHVDAPFHFDDSAPNSDTLAVDLDLDLFCGKALVLDVSGKPLITCNDLLAACEIRPARLLLKTLGWPDATVFPETIPVIASDVPDFLSTCGVKLLGVDVPSVDSIDSKDLPNHHALMRCGITILESLRLVDTPEGEYELIALPMKLHGADAAPVRALLRDCAP